MAIASTALPPAGLTTSGSMSPAAAAQSEQNQAISLVAAKTISEGLRINEKDIKTSRWAIALGVLAVTITALAIATLQPVVIASTIPLMSIIAFHAYQGFSDASAKRSLAKYLNERLAFSQKIEEYQRENSALLEEITAFKSTHLKDASLSDKIKQAEKEAEQLLSLSDRFKPSFLEFLKNQSGLIVIELVDLKQPLPQLQFAHNTLSSQLSSKEDINERAIYVALAAALHSHKTSLQGLVSKLNTTRDEIISGVRHTREKHLHI